MQIQRCFEIYYNVAEWNDYESMTTIDSWSLNCPSKTFSDFMQKDVTLFLLLLKFYTLNIFSHYSYKFTVDFRKCFARNWRRSCFWCSLYSYPELLTAFSSHMIK